MKIKALLVRVKEKPKVVEIEPNKDIIFHALGHRYLEVIYNLFPDNRIGLVCPDSLEVSLKKLKPNRAIYIDESYIYARCKSGAELLEVIYGDFLIIYSSTQSNDVEEFETLSESYINDYSKRFAYPECFDYTSKEVKVIRENLPVQRATT